MAKRTQIQKQTAKNNAKQLLQRKEKAEIYEKGLIDAAKHFAAGSFFPVDVAEGATQGAFTPPASYKAAMMRPPVPSDYQIDPETGKPVFKGKPPVVNPEYKGTTEHVGKQLGVDIADPGGLAPQAFSPDPLAKVKALGILGKAGFEGLATLGLGATLFGGLKKTGKVADMMKSAKQYKTADEFVEANLATENYLQHKLIRNKEDLEKIQNEGFKKSYGANVLPVYKGGKPTNAVDKQYAPRKGDIILLVPEDQILNYNAKAGSPPARVKEGFKPKEHEIVEIQYDFQSPIEAQQQKLKEIWEEAQKPGPIFTSPGKSAAADISKETIPANKVKNQLEGRGVSKDEMEWTGFNDWIKTKKGEVSKAEIEEFFEQNQIQVQEVVRGQISEARLEEIATKEVLNDLRQNYKDQIVDKIIQKQADEMPGGINDPAVKEAWNDSSLSSQGFLKWDDLSKDQKEGFARRYRLNPENDLPGTSESDIANAEKQFDDLIEKWGSGEITEAEQNQLDELFVSSYHSGPSSIDRMYQNTLAGIESGTYPIEHLNLPKDTLPTRYPQKDLQLPGGENYRELLLRVPAKKVPWTKENVVPISAEEAAELQRGIPNNKNWYFKTPKLSASDPYRIDSVPKKDYRGTDFLDDTDDTMPPKRDVSQEEALEKVLARQPDPNPRFTSGHWEESDVIAHIRFNERVDPDGNKVLFIEEIQSDWGKAGHEVGFKEPLTKLPEGVEIVKKEDNFGGIQYSIVGPDKPVITFTPETENINAEALSVYNEMKNRKQVQPGPFVTDAHQWTNLALKRMIRWASDEGFDSIAWVTGRQSAERYNVSKVVDEIEWYDMGIRSETGEKAITLKGVKGASDQDLEIYTNEEGLVKFTDIGGEEFKGKHIKDILGKGLGDKILSENKGVLKDADLDIGGQYHQFIYDKVLTEQAKKIGKKHGAKVEEGQITLPDPEDDSIWDNAPLPTESEMDKGVYSVWTMRLTDKLKEASREGLPYYMVLPPLVIGGAAAQRTDAQRQQAKTDARQILAQ